jgi:Ca-activated chloride channel family protein
MRFSQSAGLLLILGGLLAGGQTQPTPAPKLPAAPAGSSSSGSPGASSVTVPIAPPAAPKDQNADKQTPPIRVEVNEVIVPITVTNDQGKFVSDLSEADFQVFEDNKPQQIRFFTRERNQPIVVGFLIDLSNASRVHWKNYQDAAIELIQNLLTNDAKYSGYLISYSNDAELQVNTTSDPEKLVEKLRKMKPAGGAALYDAVYMACTNRKLVQGEPIEPRRVIVIIGDGHDSASKHSLSEVVELAQRNLVTVYGVSTVAFGFTDPAGDNLSRLAIETGGRVVYPLEDVYKDTDGYLSHPSDDGNYALKVGTGEYASAVANKMFRAVTDIAGEVTMQYIIRYIPNNDSAKAFRNVKIVVNLANVKVRARKGYYGAMP